MKILYITRKFPPTIGGMQTQSRQFYENISKRNDVFLIAWGHSQFFLPFFIIYAFVRAAIILSTKDVEIIQLGDFVLSPLGSLLKTLFKKPVLTISHGRDSVYTSPFYDHFILGSAKKLDRVICVSRNNMKTLASRGIPEDKLRVIPNGINLGDANINDLNREQSLDLIEKRFGINLREKNNILSVSRLVPKKGIREFVEDVLPSISKRVDNACFVIAGDGCEKERIYQAVNRLNLKDRVYLLGNVEHGSAIYRALFSVSNVFVMPNIRVSDDAEGFGVVALEAAVNKTPLVAYDVDGISEAVHDKENGILIKEKNAELFSDAVCGFLKDSVLRQNFTNRAREYVAKKFSWDRIIGMYEEEYLQLLKRG